MSPQEKPRGVMAQIRTFDLTIGRPALYHLSYLAREHLFSSGFISLKKMKRFLSAEKMARFIFIKTGM
jgi:hypothetical protein